MICQKTLVAAAQQRLFAARPEFAAGRALETPEDLHTARSDLTADAASDDADAFVAVCVIRDLRLTEWVRETCRFALGAAPGPAQAWRRSFTRTVYLAGNPANLQARFAFAHTAPDGSVGWAGPAPAEDTRPLRRLLKTFAGHGPAAVEAPTTVVLPGTTVCRTRSPVHRGLYLATAGITVAELLVHANHLLTEAVLDGLIGPGDSLTLRAVPRLTGLAESFAALRADADTACPERRLRAYAGLTGARP
jgi:hypothetical protein